MFTRIRLALGFAVLGILIASGTAFAKGGFSFVTITGPDLKEEVRSDDLALTQDFFAFADFSRNKTKTPVDPGVGYEITRYYMDGKREIPFDRLHYYPETGFVYYDGIVNGSSEYDGEWYTAKSEIKTVFESTLPISLSTDQTHSSESTTVATKTQSPRSMPVPQLVLLVVAGLALILLFAYRLRQASAH